MITKTFVVHEVDENGGDGVFIGNRKGYRTIREANAVAEKYAAKLGLDRNVCCVAVKEENTETGDFDCSEVVGYF